MRRRLTVVLLTILPLATVGTAATAEPAADSFAAVCGQIDDGQLVRVLTMAGVSVEAPFAGCRDDVLLLMTDSGLRTVRYEEIATLQARERHGGQGARTGAIIGAVGGGAFFFILGQIAQAVGEGENDNVNILAIILVGAGLGAGAGALSGAIVGSAVPRWHLLHARTDAPPAVSREVAGRPAGERGRVGAITATAGLGWAEGAEMNAAGLAFAMNLTANYPSGLSFGFEFGRMDAGPQPADRSGPSDPTYAVADRVWHLGGLLRYAVTVGPVRPYAVVGLAGYKWEDSFVGASFGGGVALPLRERRLTARVEYRRHDNFQNLVGSDPGFGSLTAGVEYGW